VEAPIPGSPAFEQAPEIETVNDGIIMQSIIENHNTGRQS